MRARHAVLDLQPGGVALALGAQAGDDHGERAADHEHADATIVRGRSPKASVTERRAGTETASGEQRHGGGVAGGRAGGGDQRAATSSS